MTEIDEARHIIRELAEIRDQLKPADQRFLDSWSLYLARAGDDAKLGKHRLTLLRRTIEAAKGENRSDRAA